MRTIQPAGRPLKGQLSVPGDKSISHRALMLGALSLDGLRVRGLSNGEDVRSTRRCLEALGAKIDAGVASVVVRGRGKGEPFSAAKGPLDCGNSGTTMRLMMGILSGQPFESRLIGDASLSRRPMRRVAAPLMSMGANITLTAQGCAPLTVSGRRPLRSTTYRLPVASAQVKSAVLLAGLFADGEVVVEDPFFSRDHTERMLSWLSDGKALSRQGERIRVRPYDLQGGRELNVAGDISSAAFFLAGAAMVPGSDVVARAVGLNPTRIGFLDALREMGARVEMLGARSEGGEPVGDVQVRHAPLQGLRLSADKVPSLVDEVPMLAVLAATANGESVLEGLGELRLKESDRLEGIAAGLRALGAEAKVEGENLRILGPAKFKSASLKTLGDHRLAMAYSIAALAAQGPVTIDDDACVGISYPSFYADLGRLLS